MGLFSLFGNKKAVPVAEPNEEEQKKIIETTRKGILNLFVRELNKQRFDLKPSYNCPIPNTKIVSFVEQLKKDPAIEYHLEDGYLSLYQASYNAGLAFAYIYSKKNPPDGDLLYDYLDEETRQNEDEISDGDEYFFMRLLNANPGEAYKYYTKTTSLVYNEIEKPYIAFYTLCGLSQESREQALTELCSFVFFLGYVYGMELIEWLAPSCEEELEITDDPTIHTEYDKDCETTDESNVSSNSNASSLIGVADEIKKFKELLDCEAITREEYEAKKKQLLGL